MSSTPFYKIDTTPLPQRLAKGFVNAQYEQKRQDPSFDIARSNLALVINDFCNQYPDVAQLAQSELDDYRQTLRAGYSWNSQERQYYKLEKVKVNETINQIQIY